MAEGAGERYPGLTEAQRRAVTTVGRSLLVSAAAGAGKTTVLAERCAALVCDPPAEGRCRIDELLVVTFTDAAAGEMRARIESAIRQRLAQKPNDHFLREQLYLLDSANISTIHSFCKTLIQRWFPQAGVDPQAAVLGAEEAELLRREVLDALFVELYGREDERADAFRKLVDDYADGEDAQIANIVLALHGYLASLPDPQGWLAAALDQYDPSRPDSLVSRLSEIQRNRFDNELIKQIETCRRKAQLIRTRWTAAALRAQDIEQYTQDLAEWRKALQTKNRNCDSLAQDIKAYKFPSTRKRSSSGDAENDYENATRIRQQVKEQLFENRLRDSLCRFTAEEYRAGLEGVKPYVLTLGDLVNEFEVRYQAAKSAQAVVDFNDLQRRAYQLLSSAANPSRPSEVARQIQGQYRHVLVDEYQDIDPLQEAVLRLVSRESAGVSPTQGNLFAVGDIKQSIYRFRLAEPQLFSRRAEEFAQNPARGEVIFLQENFRSRPEVLEAVNLIFEPLMSQAFGGCAYDEQAKLQAGLHYPAEEAARTFGRPAVELHLLEPITAGHKNQDEQGESEGEETDRPDAQGDDEELVAVEREAFLIGRKIREWMGAQDGRPRRLVADKPPAPGGPLTLRPIEYRDIVILLRSLPHKADAIADVLRRMNVPVRVERGENRLDSTEFRDGLSLLQILDNRQQDVPLAAVLRSALLGEPFSESDLLKIRLHNRAVPFHEAVRQYGSQGADEKLRGRLQVFLGLLKGYRRRIRQAPVAEVLWEILERHDYLAFISGLPDGPRRREHVLHLHELARQFGHFARQGLRRFLRFLEEIVASATTPKQPAGGNENVVRIMTIHHSKGLEFPVVVLADLSKKFNLEDIGGNVLIDRRFGPAPRAVDPQRRIRYPTFIHQLAAENGRREALAEELRVLYVALTRAREHLLLVGRYDPAAADVHRPGGALTSQPAAIPQLELETANNYLQWLLPAIGSAPPQRVQWNGEAESTAPPLFEIRIHPRSATDGWRIPPAIKPERADELAGLAELHPLEAAEPLADDGQADELIAALNYVYPALALTALPARVAVSELKRRWDATADPDEPARPVIAHRPAPPQPLFAAEAAKKDPLLRGTATHRFLQLLDLRRPVDAADLRQQCGELAAAGRLTAEEAGAVLIDAAAWFLATELGARIRRRADRVRRELAFISRIEPQQYDPLVMAHEQRDVVLVRGMVDLLLADEAELEIVDYKTDAVPASACGQRAAEYRPQMDYYAEAMRNIYRRGVRGKHLVFLHARRIIDLD